MLSRPGHRSRVSSLASPFRSSYLFIMQPLHTALLVVCYLGATHCVTRCCTGNNDRQHLTSVAHWQACGCRPHSPIISCTTTHHLPLIVTRCSAACAPLAPTHAGSPVLTRTYTLACAQGREARQLCSEGSAAAHLGRHRCQPGAVAEGRGLWLQPDLRRYVRVQPAQHTCPGQPAACHT
jgi:hypothetical protein